MEPKFVTPSSLSSWHESQVWTLDYETLKKVGCTRNGLLPTLPSSEPPLTEKILKLFIIIIIINI